MITASVRGIALKVPFCHSTAKLSQREGIRIQIPFENTAKLREEVVDQDLLISSTHPRDRIAESHDRMAHEHEISEQLLTLMPKVL
jgi:hypothetical protein